MKTPSQQPDEISEELRLIHNIIQGSPFIDPSLLDKWMIKTYQPLLLDSMHQIFESPKFLERLDKFQTTLDTIANMAMAITSAIYAYKVKDNTRADTLNFMSIDLKKSPFRNKLLIDIFTGENKKSLIKDISKILEEVKDNSGKNHGNAAEDSLQELQRIAISTDQILDHIMDFQRVFDDIDPKLSSISSDIVSGLGSYITEGNAKILQKTEPKEIKKIMQDSLVDPLSESLNSSQDPKVLQSIIESSITNALKDNGVKKMLEIDIKGDGLKSLESVIKNLKDAKDFKKGEADLVSTLFSLISSIGNLDKKGYKKAVRNLKKFGKLFEKPNALSKLGLSNKGLLRAILENVKDIFKDSRTSESDAKGIGDIFKTIVTIMTIDEKTISNFESNTHIINDVIKGDYKELLKNLKRANNLVKKDLKELVTNFNEIRKLISMVINSVPDYDNLEETLDSLDLLDDFLDGFKNIIKKMKFPKKEIDAAIISSRGLKSVFEAYQEAFDVVNLSTLFGDIIFNMMKRGVIAAESFIEAINKGLKDDQLKNSQKSLKTLKPVVTLFSDMLQDMTRMFWRLALMNILAPIASKGTQSMVVTIDNLTIFIERIRDLKITKSLGQSLEAISIGIREYSRMLKKVTKLGIFGKFSERGFKVLINSVDKIKEFIDNIDGLKATKTQIKAIESIAILIRKASGAILLAGLAGTLLLPLIPGLLLFGVVFKMFVSNIINAVQQNASKLKNAHETINAIISLIWKSSLVLLIGGACMMIPDLPINCLRFTVVLTLFLLGTLVAVGIGTRLIKDRGTINQIGKLIYTLGLVMVIGGLFMYLPGMAENCIQFTVVLSLFLLGVLVAVAIGKWLAGKKTMRDAVQLGHMVSMLAIVMMIGALFMMIPNAMTLAIQFTITLAIFLVGILAAIAIAKALMGKRIIKDAYDMCLLVSVLSVVMMLGALFMMIPNAFTLAMKFTGTLALFILGILIPIALIKLMMGNRAFRDVKAMCRLIAILSLILLIGAAFMFIPKMAENALKFVGIMALFILATVGIIALIVMLMSKNRKAKGLLWTFAGIILILSLIIVGAAYMMAQNPAMAEALKQFVLYSLIFVGGMALIVFLLSLIKKQKLMWGIIALAGIAVSIMLIGFAMKLLGQAYATVKAFGDLKEFEKFLIMTGVVLGAAILAVVGLGAIYNAKKDLIIYGELALAGIGANIWLMGKAMQEIAIGFAIVKSFGSIKEMWGYLGQVGVILVAAAGAIIGLGGIMYTGVGAILYAAGAAALAVLAADIHLVGKAVQEIAKAMKGLSEVKNLDTKGIKAMISSCIDIVMAFKPFAKKDAVDIAKKGSKAIKEMSVAVSHVAKAVQQYAKLKVPVYTGKKVTGYRQLSPKDFSEASTNIKKIILTVGGAIIDTYKNAPQGMFDHSGPLGLGKSPFDKVVNSCEKLGPMISKIAKGIQNYANLKMPIYDQNGKDIKGYTKMTNNDFKNAAENIKKVILTLGKAIIKTYEMDPKMFDAASVFGKLFGGETVFSKVVKSVTNLGKMISQTAKGIQDYAMLKVPIYSEKSKEPTGYKQLNQTDFRNAANNISLVITTLGRAVMTTYMTNPMMFDSGLITDSPFKRVVDSCSALGKMISSLAKGIQDYAMLKVPIYKSNSSEISGYRNLSDKDFTNAAANIGKVIITLGSAIIDTYNKRPDLFYTDLFKSKTDFEIVIDSCKNLGKLIADLAQGVQSYANLKIPVYEGTKIKSYKQLSSKDFVKAAENIEKIVSTLGSAIINLYNKRPDIFKQKSDQDSPFTKVVKSSLNLSTLISKLAQGVQNYATLKIPIYEGTKIVGYQSLKNKDFDDAADNIQNIISTVGGAIIKLYESNPKMFKTDKDSKFDIVIKSTMKMSNMIMKIGQAVRYISSLQIPIFEGLEIVGFERLSNGDFENAANNIREIVTVIGSTILGLYESRPEIFKNVNIQGSIFDIMVRSIGKMSNMIMRIGQAVKYISSLQIPIFEGLEITGFEKLTENDFTNAANNISKIVSNIGDTLIKLYNEKPNIFKNGFEQGSIFDSMIISITKMSNMIMRIGKAVRYISSLQIPIFNGLEITGFEKLTESDFTNAATNISKIVSTIGDELVRLYKEKPAIFKNSSDEGSIFNTMINSTINMATMINKIGKAIKYISSLQMPIFTGLEITGYEKITEKDFINAANNIKQVISTIAGAILGLYNSNKDMFQTIEFENSKPTNKFEMVMKSCSDLSLMVNRIANAIKLYSSMMIPEVINGKASIKKMTNNDFLKAGETIASVISCLANSIISMYDKRPELFETPEDGGENKFSKVMKSAISLGSMLSSIAEGVKNFASLKIPVYKGDKISSYRTLKSEDFELAAKGVEKVITTLGKAVIDTYKNNPNLFGQSTEFDNIVSSFQGVGTLLGDVANAVFNFASNKVPIYSGDKIVRYEAIGEAHYNAAATCVESILTLLVKAIISVYGGTTNGYKNKDFFSGESPWLIKISDAIGNVVDLVGNVASTILEFVSGQIPTKWNTKGEVIESISMKDLDFNQVSTNINTILKGLVEPIISVYSDSRIKSLWDKHKEDDNPLSVISGVIRNISNMLGGVAANIVTFAGSAIPTKFGSDGQPTEFVSLSTIDLSETSTWYTAIKNMLTLMPSLIHKLITDDSTKNLFDINNSLYQNDGEQAKLIQKIYPTLAAICVAAIKAATNVVEELESYGTKQFNSQLLIGILSSVPKAVIEGCTVNKSGQALLPIFEMSIDDKLSKISAFFDFIGDILIESVENAYKAINSSQLIKEEWLRINSTAFRNIFKNEYNLPVILNKAYIPTIVEEIKNDIISTYKNVDKIIETVAEVYVNAESNLSRIFDPEATVQKVIQIINGLNDIDFEIAERIPTNLDEVARIIKASVKDFLAALEFPIPDEKTVNSLTWSINEIDTTVSQVKDPVNFTKEVKSTDDFVKTVNKVDLAKTNAMTELMKAMKESLDVQNTNRVQELIRKLTETIDVLTNELNRTSETMKTAEKIHKERHKVLGETVKTVKELINKPVTVTVVSDDTEGDVATQATNTSSSTSTPTYTAPISGSSVGPGSTGSNLNTFETTDPAALELKKLRKELSRGFPATYTRKNQ